MDRWVGKTAIVTGASSGIGYAIAVELVKHGVNVAALARRTDRLKELEKEASKHKGKLVTITCDVSQEDQILKAFKEVKEKLGLVHIMINNAGVMIRMNAIDMEVSKFKTILDTNVIGLATCAREAIKIMKENNIRGHIININSIVGQKIIQYPSLAYYSASKYAVTALTEMMRLDMSNSKTPIKITSLSPGHVTSEMSRAVTDFHVEPVISAEELAQTVILALSTAPAVNISEMTVQPLLERY